MFLSVAALFLARLVLFGYARPRRRDPLVQPRLGRWDREAGAVWERGGMVTHEMGANGVRVRRVANATSFARSRCRFSTVDALLGDVVWCSGSVLDESCTWKSVPDRSEDTKYHATCDAKPFHQSDTHYPFANTRAAPHASPTAPGTTERRPSATIVSTRQAP